MKRVFLVFALWAAPVAGSSDSTLSAATAWLKSHKSPTGDQLGELQNSNPEAFAIVNALLSKHRHAAQLPADERGPDVFRRMLTPHERSSIQSNVAAPYAAADIAVVQHSAVVDRGSYNPNAAANRDESSVSRLLDAVASLGGARGKKIALLNHRRHQKQTREDDNLLTQDASLFGDAANPTPPALAIEQAAQQPIQVPQEAAVASTKNENPYLKGIGLDEDMPGVKAAHKHIADDSSNNLANFSFDGVAPEVAAAAPTPAKVAAPLPKKENSLLKWLGATKRDPAPEERLAPATPAAAKKSNYAGFFS